MLHTDKTLTLLLVNFLYCSYRDNILCGVEIWDASIHILEVAKKAAPPKKSDLLTEHKMTYLLKNTKSLLSDWLIKKCFHILHLNFKMRKRTKLRKNKSLEAFGLVMSYTAARPGGRMGNCISTPTILKWWTVRGIGGALITFSLCCQADPNMLAILFATLVLHLTDLIILFVATCANVSIMFGLYML